MIGLFRKSNLLSATSKVELKLLSDRFEVHRALFEAPHAIAYDALDTSSGTRVFLWRLKAAVPSALADKMLEHMLIPIFRTGVPSPALVCFGIAQGGILFYASEQSPSPSILDKEVQPRWKGLYVARMARFLAYLHSQKVTLGFLHQGSFLANRDDSLLFNGLFPVVASQLNRDELRGATLEFAAPELRLGKPLNAASDVFSLGAYVYHFISEHEFPSHLNEQQLYQHLRVQLPILCSKENNLLWLRPILEKMLQWKPERRYPNCEVLFQELSQQCPEMGMFGAGTLKSIDNAAASYVLSPFSRAAVATVTIALLVAVAVERVNDHTAESATATGLQQLELGITSAPHEIARADLRTISQLPGAETGTLPGKKPVPLSEAFRNAAQPSEEAQVSNSVFYDLSTFEGGEEEVTTEAVEEKSERSRSEDYSITPSPVAIRNTSNTVKKPSSRRLHPNRHWLLEDDSALLSVLVHGSISADKKRPWCRVDKE